MVIGKHRVLVTKIKSIDYIITDNEIEAYLLESNLIKKHRPIFNIELKRSAEIHISKNYR